MTEAKFTVRMDVSTHSKLKFVSQELNKSMNAVVSDAIETYLPGALKKIEDDLTRRMELLDKYKGHDPQYEHAIAAIAEAESVEVDPAEGVEVRPKGSMAPREETPAMKKLDRLIQAG